MNGSGKQAIGMLSQRHRQLRFLFHRNPFEPIARTDGQRDHGRRGGSWTAIAIGSQACCTAPGTPGHCCLHFSLLRAARAGPAT